MINTLPYNTTGVLMSARAIADTIARDAIETYSTAPVDLETLDETTAEIREELVMIVAQSLLVEVVRYDTSLLVSMTALHDFVYDATSAFERDGDPALFLFNEGDMEEYAQLINYLVNRAVRF